MENKKVMKIASPGKRLGAWLIDELIFWVAIVICSLFIAVPHEMIGGGYHDDIFEGLAGLAMITLFLVGGLAYIIVQLYFYSKSQTIGKAILGLRVVNKKDGSHLTFWWMLFREIIVKKASGVVFGLGYIWILIDKKHQGWHDKILDTYVIDDRQTASLVYSVPSEDSTAPTAIASEEKVSEPAAESHDENIEDTIVTAVPAAAETAVETEMPDADAKADAEKPAEELPPAGRKTRTTKKKTTAATSKAEKKPAQKKAGRPAKAKSESRADNKADEDSTDKDAESK